MPDKSPDDPHLGYPMHARFHAGTVLTAFVFVASLLWLGQGVHVGTGGDDTPSFHIDEAHKLGEAFYYHLLFQERDLNHPAWTDDFYARTNPPVAKYVFGAVLAAAGEPVRDRKQQEDFEAAWQTPERLRSLVPDGMLRVTRYTSVVFGAGICALLFLMARRAAGTAAGLIAVALLLGNPSFTQTARRGLTDTILLFHLALIVPVTFWTVGVLRRHWEGQLAGGAVRKWCTLVAATVLVPGLAIALATGSKLNGWLTGPTYAASLVLAALLCTGVRPVWRRLALVFVTTPLAAVTAVAVFIGVNPHFHHDPIGRMAGLLNIWGDWMVTQQVFPGPGLYTLHQKATAVGYYSLRDPSLPLWRLMDTVHAGSLGGWLAALGFAAGLVYLAGRCLPGSRMTPETNTPERAAGRGRLDAAVVLCWVVICTTGIALWLPVLWDRHLLPPYLTICLTTAIGLAVLPRGIRSVAALLVRRSTENGVLRVAVGAASVIGLWIVLAFTPWVIRPALLPDPMAWTNLDALDSEPESHLVHGNAGLMLQYLGMNKQAAEQFETALRLLDRNTDGRSSFLPQRCYLLCGLARARTATGDSVGGIEALQQYIAVLEKLRNGMKTTDRYVRSAYDLRIAEGTAELARLTQKPSGG